MPEETQEQRLNVSAEEWSAPGPSSAVVSARQRSPPGRSSAESSGDKGLTLAKILTYWREKRKPKETLPEEKLELSHTEQEMSLMRMRAALNLQVSMSLMRMRAALNLQVSMSLMRMRAALNLLLPLPD
ncbi:hypothetical protein WMY93_025526 [Mugilogobius chulae]|uniref:Uncharacterized protein n=1 Tax=Mugilogobius chulae TaxID=88201 RepID=A0AAW0N6Q7_9GOBI